MITLPIPNIDDVTRVIFLSVGQKHKDNYIVNQQTHGTHSHLLIVDSHTDQRLALT